MTILIIQIAEKLHFPISGIQNHVIRIIENTRLTVKKPMLWCLISRKRVLILNDKVSTYAHMKNINFGGNFYPHLCGLMIFEGFHLIVYLCHYPSVKKPIPSTRMYTFLWNLMDTKISMQNRSDTSTIRKKLYENVFKCFII